MVSFVHNGQLYTAFNATHLPPIPDPGLPLYKDESNTFLSLRWLRDDFPYLAFIPSVRKYEGPLFHRLAQPLLVDQGRTGWQLSAEIMTSWWNLELSLINVRNHLFAWSTLQLPGTKFRLPVDPWEFGYPRVHYSKAAVIKSAEAAREAFLPLMAFITFLICVKPDHESPDALWVHRLVEERKMNAEWVARLRQSIVCDWTCSRLGTFVDPWNIEFRYVHTMVNNGCPVWIRWGDVSNGFPVTAIPELFRKYFPKPDEINEAYDRSRGPHLIEQLVQQMPLPEPGSRQRQGETMAEFFEREAHKNARKEEKETEAERTTRLARAQKLLDSHPLPGKKGAVVFYWEKDNGFRRRTRVNRGEVVTYWCTYGRTQKRYNSFMNEWDICSEFDINGDPEDDEFPLPFETSTFAADSPHASSSVLPEPSTSVIPQSEIVHAQDRSHADIAAIYGNPAFEDVEHGEDQAALYPVHDSIESLDSLLYYRFGFISGGAGTSEMTTLTWTDIRKSLVDSMENYMSPVENSMKGSIASFVGHFLEKPPRNPPPESWDLSSDCDPQSQPDLKGFISVVPKVFEGEVMYFIEPRQYRPDRDGYWQLLLPSAANALECVRRRWGPHIDDVVRHLLDKGMAFSTRVSKPRHDPIFRSLPLPIGLGSRPQGYTASAADYAAYEDIRNAFLRQPQGRAALMKGGIVARLAKSVLGPWDVILGPSEHACVSGHRLQDPHVAGQYLWDDNLSEEELAIICGVYEVFTGTRTKTGQTTHMSWWPKHSVWEKSSMNVNYWSRDCEAWFQTRLNQIRANRARPKSPTEWRNSLRLMPKSSQVAAANERVAAAYLEANIGSAR